MSFIFLATGYHDTLQGKPEVQRQIIDYLKTESGFFRYLLTALPQIAAAITTTTNFPPCFWGEHDKRLLSGSAKLLALKIANG